ncbi:head maturation protease, ClpP-related [Xanthomonas campestris]|uniref:head maturation protease, ClpP-related n=1 Tax=Xanthomonas campestris TaxID=339 RepID=UPI000E1F7483|nr:head maturation protease, ClpP-related [Xanthomonas campestris]
MPIILTFYRSIEADDAEWVLQQLQQDPRADVDIHINSAGGHVHAALAIFNALKARQTRVYIDGIAASAASVIAMAGKRVIAAENALVMIHDPWTTVTGNSTEMRRHADMLDMHRDALLLAYSRTGQDRAVLLQMLAEETWLTASEALRLGFVDEITEAQAYAAHAPTCFASYTRTPKELLAMPQPHNHGARAPHSTSPSSDSSTAVQAAVAAIRERNTEILAIAEPHLGNSEIRAYVDSVIASADMSVSLDQVGRGILAIMGRHCEPLGGYLGVAAGSTASAISNSSAHRSGTDFVNAASDALALRAGIRLAKPHPGARDVQGMALSDIMRASLSRSGRSDGFGANTRGDLVRAAMSTSDFPAILENTLGKALRAGYEAEPATYETWTRRVLVPDFKQQSRVLLGSAPQLLPVPEGGEYALGSMEDDKSVPYSVKKFGRLVQLTWEALVNDDLGAFLRITQAMGQAAARAEGDAVYATFADNAAAGTTMQDSRPLFHAEHKNLATAFSGITADALAAARILLRRQIAVGGGALNLPPRFLLVAPEHEQAAEILLAAAARSLSQGESNTLIPAWLAQLQLIVEARLPASAFYVLTSPDAVDTLERAHLEEDNGPRITEDEGFKTDARTYKVRHVFAARWLDWRGVAKVPLT